LTTSAVTTASAVDAAVAVARAHGHTVERPRVLAESNNVIVDLAPAPVVARVANTIAAVREEGGAVHLRREVEIAGWAAERGGPVVPPSRSMPPGPHECGGHLITFWERADGEAGASFEEAAPVLRELHELLVDYPGQLRVLSPVLDEVPAMLAAVAGDPGAAERARLIGEHLELARPELIEHALPIRPLHGDSHPGNLLRMGDRLVWNDFEDACLAPVQWDLACLLRMPATPTAEGLAVYGPDIDPRSIELFETARIIQGAAWLNLLSMTDSDKAQLRDQFIGWLHRDERRRPSR
jgi:hypothetical protein